MKTYKLLHPTLGEIQYQDPKRALWLLSVLWPLMPLLTIAVYQIYPVNWIFTLPLIVGYIVVPVLDHCIGTDQHNPNEAMVPLLEKDKYYYYLLLLPIPLYFISVIASAYFVSHTPLPWESLLLFTIAAGLNGGLSINSAHEIGHKNTKANQRLSRLCLAVTGYGHFCVDHNLGHHRDVATPHDPVSAQMGESIYRFCLREISGSFLRAHQAQKKRLQRQNKTPFSWHNPILQSYAITLLYQGSLIALWGWILLPFFLLHNAIAWFQLTSANYIEHYGLLREKKANGRYEPCRAHHSWNANHTISNLLLYQLERHSDHHANPSRSYQSLRSLPNVPELPSGYFGMYVLAYIPTLWFHVMDTRLMHCPHIQGDLNKINIHPKHKARIQKKWQKYTQQSPR